jgi:hypothetical protein
MVVPNDKGQFGYQTEVCVDSWQTTNSYEIQSHHGLQRKQKEELFMKLV